MKKAHPRTPLKNFYKEEKALAEHSGGRFYMRSKFLKRVREETFF